jgi:hypothetical protein
MKGYTVPEYQDPRLVKSPKYAVSHLDVRYDGGAQTADTDRPDWAGWSYARLEWCEEPAGALRWNGNETSVGMPQARGMATWFILPKPIADVLEAHWDEVAAAADPHPGGPRLTAQQQ